MDTTSSIIIGLLQPLHTLHEMPVARSSSDVWSFYAAAQLLVVRRGWAQARTAVAASAGVPANINLLVLTEDNIRGAENLSDEAVTFLLRVRADEAKARQRLLKIKTCGLRTSSPNLKSRCIDVVLFRRLLYRLKDGV